MKLLAPILLAGSTLALASSLGPDPGPRTVSTPSEAARFAIDGTHSAVLFRSKHLGLSQFWGRFDQVSGEVEYDAADPEASSIRVLIPAESVNSNSEARDRHLRNADFLNAQEFPEIVFESTAIAKRGDGLAVTGELSFHGETREVTAEAEVIGSGDTPFGDYRLGLEARFEIDMRDFGVEFVTKSPGAVGPTVQLVVSLECIRQ